MLILTQGEFPLAVYWGYSTLNIKGNSLYIDNIKIGTYESVQRCGKISKDLRMSKNKGMKIYMMPKE